MTRCQMSRRVILGTTLARVDPGVVDEHIEPVERAIECGHDRLDVFGSRDVTGRRFATTSFGANGVHRLGERGSIDIGDEEARAGARKSRRDRTTERPAGASHDRDTIRQEKAGGPDRDGRW